MANGKRELLVGRLRELLERADDETLELMLLFLERYINSRS